ncbi:thiazole synthase [Polyangium sorediatum]|uniref:Thiazole synthase n=1 Tax=Polyangium sorediatum TaxID=889274 RepID=A0ABT6NRV6_9BACT|nr:thiazole synthase [Polyangium sorediatum]MDI1431062.1 thiazole synthase [Polyangium sorediatum]
MVDFYGRTFESRLLLGTARYPSPEALGQAVARSGAQIVTVSLRRESAAGAKAGQAFWELVKALGVTILPNTAGCHSAREAVTTARMAREVFGTPWIKLEVIGDDVTLQPDPFALVDATRALVAEGFEVFPYMTEDLVLAEKLVEAGCRVLMPWGAPIGTGRGLNNPYALRLLRRHFPGITLVVDAGIGAPSHAAAAMEMGYDALLLNTAVATAGDPPAMAEAFAEAIRAGRRAHEAGLMEPTDLATASTPTFGAPFSPFAG